MEMKINTAAIKNERNKRAWSQQHLSEAAELSLRTVQRIEASGVASPESIKSIAAAFEVSVESLLIVEDAAVETLQVEEVVQKKPGSFITKSMVASLLAIIPILFATFYAFDSNQTSAQATTFYFSGGVRVNENDTHAFDLRVAINQVHTIQIDPDHQLLFITPIESGDDAVTEVKMLQRQRDSYNILHTARTIGSSKVERSISYRVCDKENTFYTPAKSNIPLC